MEDSVLSWVILNITFICGLIKIGSLFPVSEKKKDVYIENMTSYEISEKTIRNKKHY